MFSLFSRSMWWFTYIMCSLVWSEEKKSSERDADLGDGRESKVKAC